MSAKLISCKVMIEELRPLLGPDVATEVFDISLHTRPMHLHATLQQAVTASDGLYDPILLGYGMCSKATIGLVAQHSHLVVPKSDDCIAIFMGSKAAHRASVEREPGTYFLTQGWIGGGGGTVFNEYERIEAKFGAVKARMLMDKMLGHYKRLAYIRVPNAPVDADRAYAQGIAQQFGMEFVELEGTDQWLKRLADHEWGDDFVVAGPGEVITLEHFMNR